MKRSVATHLREVCCVDLEEDRKSEVFGGEKRAAGEGRYSLVHGELGGARSTVRVVVRLGANAG